MKTLPRGIRNNNPLNLIRTSTKWLGLKELQGDPRFCQFKTMEWGIRAAIINIRSICKRNHACTIAQLINIWAPSFENNTQAYIKRVCDYCPTLKPDTIIDPYNFSQIHTLICAMSVVENGNDYLTEDVVLRAFRLARGNSSPKEDNA